MGSIQKRHHVGEQKLNNKLNDSSNIYEPDESRTLKSRRRTRRQNDVFEQAVMFLRLATLFVTACILVFVLLYFYKTETSFPTKNPTDIHHNHVYEGDKSRRYAQLREEYDVLLPYSNTDDLSRIRNVVQSITQYTSQPMDPTSFNYDVYNCPLIPPLDYPMSWNVMKVLEHWRPEDVQPQMIVLKSNQTSTLIIHQSLCIFDYELQLDAATHYRQYEVPFVIRNDPNVLRTVERWNRRNYLSKLMGQTKYPVEFSSNNHFIYWDKKKAQTFISNDHLTTMNKTLRRRNEWKQPTQESHMTFDEWMSHNNQRGNNSAQTDETNYYLRLIGCGKGLGRKCARPSAEFLFDELPFFKHTYSNSHQTTTRKIDSFYLVEPNEQKGIHCRFAMQGTISESHFDDSRNFIALLAGGPRRYVLAHPNQCNNMYLYPKTHPSARQSSVNWSYPDSTIHPRFMHLLVNEVVLNPGDVLYLPTGWFHFIVSLDYNIQCNTRSGRTVDYETFIRKCGF